MTTTQSIEIEVAYKTAATEYHVAGCQAASRKAVEVSARTAEVSALRTFLAECEAEAAELGEAGTIFHGCLKRALR